MGRMNEKFYEFLTIAKKLNDIHIIPLLTGSVGLEIVTHVNWDAQDLDIHVPGDKRGWEVPADQSIFDWQRIVEIMESLEYRLIDLHEHEFQKNDLSVGFGIIDTLPSFAGVLLEDLKIHQKDGIQFYLLTAHQYLNVYRASSKDSYRAKNNNHKDMRKLDYLKKMNSY